LSARHGGILMVSIEALNRKIDSLQKIESTRKGPQCVIFDMGDIVEIMWSWGSGRTKENKTVPREEYERMEKEGYFK
jgi:hypothetical protein